MGKNRVSIAEIKEHLEKAADMIEEYEFQIGLKILNINKALENLNDDISHDNDGSIRRIKSQIEYIEKCLEGWLEP